MKFFPKLEDLSQGKAKPFLYSILNAIMYLQDKLIIYSTIVYSYSLDSSVPKRSIKYMLPVIKSTDSLEQVVIMFSDRN